MDSAISGSQAKQGGHPVLRATTSFPVACFTCALLTDIAYVQTENIMWAQFSGCWRRAWPAASWPP